MTRLLDGAPYTPASKMGPDYLRERFKQIREQQEKDSDLEVIPSVQIKGKQMSDSDYRQQQEAEEERMQQELAALRELKARGMNDLAEFFAADLGLTKQLAADAA